MLGCEGTLAILVSRWRRQKNIRFVHTIGNGDITVIRLCNAQEYDACCRIISRLLRDDSACVLNGASANSASLVSSGTVSSTPIAH